MALATNEHGAGVSTDGPTVAYDDWDFDWGPLKPYMDGDALVIPVMDVIADSFWGSGLSAKSVQKALFKHKSAIRIKLLINSPGGEVHEGTAIYSLLREDGRPIEAHVIGIAASMASIILLAADTRILHTGAMVMIHEPALWYTAGNRHQLQSDVDRLTATNESMLDIYVERTGHAREELAALMAKESWLTAEEARTVGFGTAVEPVEPEPMMATAAADPGWNTRRGGALAKYTVLPAAASQNAPLGWRGPSLAELRAAHDLAVAHQHPTFAAALDGVRRARPSAQSPRESTPPPRPAPPQPAASTSRTNTMPFPKELLDKLGLTSSATDAEVYAAMTAKANEAETLATAKAEAEARAKAETQARIEAEANAKIAKEQREREALAAAEAKALADYTLDVQAFLADVTPSLKSDFEAMAFHEEVGPDGAKKRRPNPEGFARAKRMKKGNPAASISALSGPSAQAQTARQVVAAGQVAGNIPSGPVKYRFAGATQELDLTRLTGITPEKLAKRQAEMQARAQARDQARAQTRGLAPND